MKLVVYDLDHTLMPIDTGDTWCKWLLALCDDETRRRGFATIDRFAEEYIAQTLSIEEFETWQMQFLAQFHRKDLEAARLAYKSEVLAKIIPQKAAQVVREAQAAGAVTAICSATYSFATRPSAELFAVDHLLSVEPEEDAQGEFTGRWIEPITYQQGKVAAVKRLVSELEREGTVIDAYEFWSDSAADLALFEYTEAMGGTCFVVNAREGLLRTAAGHGWRTGRTFTDEEEARAHDVVAKALAKLENAPRLCRKK